jgi:uncharacterized protein
MNTSPNAVEWFEIPTANIEKSILFYNQILGLKLEAKEYGPNKIAILPHQDPGPGGCLQQGEGMIPSSTGTIVYLSAKAIDPVLAQVKAAGGKVLVPKTQIGPGMGYFARFQDLDGNRVGLAAQE